MPPNTLADVVNLPLIRDFLSNNPEHLAIFDALLSSPFIGVDIEVRPPDDKNGQAHPIPVINLCVDGLDQLFSSHPTLKEKLEITFGRKIIMGATKSPAQQPEELEQLKKKLEIETTAILEEKLRYHNEEFEKQMKAQQRNYSSFLEKNFNTVSAPGFRSVQLPESSAVKLLTSSDSLFEKYKQLHVEALVKYKKELKGHYQEHLHGIEKEVKQVLESYKAHSGRAEVSELTAQVIERTVDRATHFNPSIPEIRMNRNVNPINMLDMHENSKGFEQLMEKSVLDGGLYLPPFQMLDDPTSIYVPSPNGMNGGKLPKPDVPLPLRHHRSLLTHLFQKLARQPQVLVLLGVLTVQSKMV